MTEFKVGDVVWVEFPFSDFQARKRRPALVLGSGAVDLLMARITTHPPREDSDVGLNKSPPVHILASNLLRDQLGPDFIFDPWASAADRTVIIDKLRIRLSAKKD